VALTLVLLVAAGLLTRSLSHLLAVDPGFRTSRITKFDLNLPDKNYPSPPQQIRFFEQLIARLNSTTGVETAAATSILPFSGIENMSWVTVDGRISANSDIQPLAEHREITTGYFEALGIPLLKGRAFTAQDNLDSPPVVIVNEAFARQLLPPGKDPIGRRISIQKPADAGSWRTIVGVIGDVHSSSLSEPPHLQLYLPHTQINQNVMMVVVKSHLAQAELVAAAKAAVKELDPALPLAGIRTMEGVLSSATERPRFSAYLLALFACLALLLALVGISGSVAWAVSQRTQEMGLRMALGAQSYDLLKLVVGQGIKPVLLGLALGLAGALALTRLMRGLLFEVSATDPATFVGITTGLLVVALLACWIPARRATKVDPMIALRCD
jgi:putative ABC transport system permease protein